MNASAHSSISRFLVSLGIFILLTDTEYCSAHLFAEHVPVSYLLIALPHNAQGLGFRVMLCAPKLIRWFCTLTLSFASTHCSGGIFFPCRSVFHILKAVLSKEDCYDISMEAKTLFVHGFKFISFIWAERLDSRFLNKVIYVWVLMSEVCLNVLKVISNAYYATLPVKEVGALILVLGNISSSAI